MIITSGDAVYKMDYNKVLEYHIAKKADITVVCRDLDQGEDATRFGILKMNENMRIEDFEEKPMGGKFQHDFHRNLYHPQTSADRSDRAFS